MPPVDLEKAVQAAKSIVRQAHKEGKLQNLTNRIVRKEIEKQLELEDGALEEKEYKKRLNDAVKQAVDSLAEDEPQQGQSTRKDSKAKPKAKPKERKPRSKTTPSSSSMKHNNSDAPETVVKQEKAKSAPISTDAENSKKKLKVKSKEIIDDDDEEFTSPKSKVQPTDFPSSKKPRKRLVQSDDEAENIESTTPLKKRSKTKDSDIAVDPKKPVSLKENDIDAIAEASGEKKPDVSLAASGSGDSTLVDDGVKSDSEMSILIDDEPPKRKKKGKSEVKKAKSTGKEKKPKEPKVSVSKSEVSPEEEQLKKMKALVFACGVRKVWSKELKDIESHPKQIAHIRGILTGLGMKGRFSLEQARAIKEKRELQQEIEEVRIFAAKHAGEGHPKRAASTSKASVSANTNSNEESEEEEVIGPSRRKNARQSIMAFLEDQSDEE